MSQALDDLLLVMDRLRSPGGCPWDAEQSHRSLLPYLTEEAYELIEAVETDDRQAMQEELGDLLLQVIFHARIAQEHDREPFGIDDVARSITHKLISRHQHVFGDGVAETAADVERDWERLKAEEKGRSSAMDGIPLAQPALALAQKMMHRAARHGVTMETASAVSLPTVTLETVGELLFSIVALAQENGIDAEAALRSRARLFAEQVSDAEVGGRVLTAPDQERPEDGKY